MCFGKSDIMINKPEKKETQVKDENVKSFVNEVGIFKKPTPVVPEIPPKTFGNCTI